MITFEEIESYVEVLLKGQRIELRPNIKVVALANKLGFVVGNADLPDKIQGVIAYDDIGNSPQLGTQYSKLIAVEKTLSIEEKRFIVAHEIGHYLLSQRSITPVKHLDYRIDIHGKDDSENTMDYFAACLLMPKSLYAESVKEELRLLGSPDIENQDVKQNIAKKLSGLYVVPYEAALRRIDEIHK